ncbi:hypothetical protein HGP16_25335 [Rhizobium sp. P40RR-XXII]|uniref:hypothetical protein n=1 Tax=Rhizobium sp. P40RR-XXII TaxID=2726739 RepID=UPI0014578E3D|nr:hypothetical protein [Rhizobium sp. P40RR-XXII]NLS19866.1 hypothetical protein [Rhizobium sp. P40RR-XXII]
MNTTTIDRIKALKAGADSFASFHDHYSEKYAVDSHCDKKGYGFNRDDRFAAFKLTISFDSWAGYYGNSGCSSILSVSDQDIAKKAFIEALNVNQKLIFATMAKLMTVEAESLTAKAKNEIAALQALVAEFDTPDPVAA